MTNQEYVDRVNNGEYSQSDFVNDKIGFGLAQWTFHTRKQALYDTCKGKIGNLNCQLHFLVDELEKNYIEVNELLKRSNDVRECTVKVLTDFENPKRQDSSVQDYRTKLANKFYHGLSGDSISTPISSTVKESEITTSLTTEELFGPTTEIISSSYYETILPSTSKIFPSPTQKSTSFPIPEPEPTLSGRTYTVKDGDNLTKIAEYKNV